MKPIPNLQIIVVKGLARRRTADDRLVGNFCAHTRAFAFLLWQDCLPPWRTHKSCPCREKARRTKYLASSVGRQMETNK
jgi:hypothetical protein